jgi:effector-binding domain-containing protein
MSDTLVIELTDVAPVPLAAVQHTTLRAELGRTIMSGLDAVYALLRARGTAGLGHNVVVYRSGTGWGPDDTLQIEVGVQTPAPIAPEGEVLALASPGGRAATATHVGAYQTMRVTNQAIRRWMVDQGLTPGVDWEVYGDWSDDEANLTTQIYFLVSEGGA